MHYIIKRLDANDYESYHKLRIEGATLQENEFRYSAQDEIKLSKQNTIERLNSDFVIGAYHADSLIGIGGISQFSGSKINHRALLWGMYVRKENRGTDAANQIIDSLINHSSHIKIEKLLLTVVSDNIKAIHFYKKWGFVPYAIDANAVKISNGNYLDEILMVRSL